MKITILLAILLNISYTMKVTPVRTGVTFCNEKYATNLTTAVKRYGRKSDYYFFVYATLLKPWGNNITVHMVFNEFLHNEYRRSFIEFKYKLCNFLSDDAYIGPAFRNLIPCPIPAIHHELENITFPTKSFPNVFPFKKGRVDIYLNLTNTIETIASGYVEVVFEQKQLPITKKKSKLRIKLGKE